jgi:chromosome segregation ATPase
LYQRQEKADARQELENQIQHLLEEVSHLKATNRQLHLEKQELETAMHDQKVKSDSVIANLRSMSIDNCVAMSDLDLTVICDRTGHVVTLNKKINDSKLSSSPSRHTPSGARRVR